MIKNPEISIVMNCHNGEAYLSEAIMSIISQTFENWELIFFDNKSSDKSEEILKSFKDTRIKFFKSNKFLNLYDAKNLAIKKCSGEYISFLDTDDIMIPNKLEKQLFFIKKNLNFKIIYTNYHVLKKDNKYIRYNNELPSGKITQKLLDFYCLGINTVFLSKKVFDHYNFENNLNIIGDFDFFVKASQKFEIGYIADPLTIYRVHDNSYMSKNLKMYILELSNWIKKNEIDFKKKNYSLTKQKFYIMKLRIKYLLSRLNLL